MGEALIYAGIIVILYKILIQLSLNKKFRWILYESPTVLIQNGDIDRKALKKVRLPLNELLSQLRGKGFTDIQNIALAIMEDTGDISVIPKAEYRPIQPHDLNLPVKKSYLPIPLILDGQIVYANLKYLQLNQSWLMNELQKRGEKAENIILATYLEDGDLFIDNNDVKNGQNDLYHYKPGREK
ncbi:DUF421 domain-containing protein [Bacillus sp. FJAT-27251]|uniref:DUF421 domain-containing protein n=1 Tax=Bacillus sp. FJAT-27251 TaxID=1684142 RepID=UPI0018D0E854|nr:DUF421 domain-containing protein [Bacillus sp. FJAT-27251]